MRNALLILFFTLFTCSLSAQEAKKNQKAVIKTTLYCNHCKVCETCGKNFQTNLLKIKGVKMYEHDDKEMTITVYYNAQKTDLQTIKVAISKMGYDADEVKADVAAYEQLDGCCKKE
ncbi:heavy-metal-associated domain-containing protein [Flavobacterium terrisoli]|uniref:heavy-metal-associated domain-containing protein n=1 Tax=Flavobacterium terrisoli TaxID=3242195 RepID=UPI0025431425|nr:heavy metal-associated domain-containing protein [Flavobacterium buctense]